MRAGRGGAIWSRCYRLWWQAVSWLLCRHGSSSRRLTGDLGRRVFVIQLRAWSGRQFAELLRHVCRLVRPKKLIGLIELMREIVDALREGIAFGLESIVAALERRDSASALNPAPAEIHYKALGRFAKIQEAAGSRSAPS